MNGPPMAIHLDDNSDVKYGCDYGRDLVEIIDSFVFKSNLWFLVQWDGYPMLEAVPANVLTNHFRNRLVEYMEVHSVFGQMEDSDSE